MTSTKMLSSTTVTKTRFEMLKRFAKKQVLRNVWDKFLFGDEENISINKDKEIRRLKHRKV